VAAERETVVRSSVVHRPEFIRWLAVRNTEAEAVPSHSLMEPFGYDAAAGVFLIRKPSKDSATGLMVSGRTPIGPYNAKKPIFSQGKGTFSLPMPIRFDWDDPDLSGPLAGEEWGSQASSWALHYGQTGYKAISDGSADGFVAAGQTGLTSGQTVVYARVVSLIAVTQNPYCCESRTECFYNFYLASLQKFDEACGAWVDKGDCVLLFEINAKHLVIGERYPATLVINQTSKKLTGIIIPVGEGCLPNSTPALYTTHLSAVTRTIRVAGLIGTLCVGSGSGGSGSTGTGSNRVLKIYGGPSERWNEQLCTWEVIEAGGFIAHNRGCDLVVGNRYQADFHKMVPLKAIGCASGSGSGASCSGSGSGSGGSSGSGPRVEDCFPLFLTGQSDPKGLKDIACIGGIQIKYTYTGDCDEVSAASAGCCTCSGSSAGSGGGASCPCDGVPTSNKFQVSTFALTNDTCTNCAIFPANFTMTKSGACVWYAATLPGPCGGSSSATLGVTSSGATLFIGGSSGFSATYTLSGAFNCNGNNTLTKTTSEGCANFPATVSVNAVP
jgi:hypothetical protein